MQAELNNELSITGASITPLELSLPENLPMDEWAGIGRKLLRSDKMLKWWIGDWAAFGEKKYGALKQFCETNGFEYQTVANAGWVSKSVELSRRRESLSWSAHVEVAALPPKDQNKWLQRAEDENLPVVKLRQQIRQAGAVKNALESDGPIMAFASKMVDDLLTWLRGRESGWWNETRRQQWRIRLQPIARFYEEL